MKRQKQDCRTPYKDQHRAKSGSMSNNLMSSKEMKHMDNMCGIHGAARSRKGAKKGTHGLSRRLSKKDIARVMRMGKLLERSTHEKVLE
jgi:hypothetical protein